MIAAKEACGGGGSCMEMEKEKPAAITEAKTEAKTEATTYVLRPRKRWGRRILLSMILIVGGVLVGQWYLGYVQEEQLSEEIEELRSMKEPMASVDFVGRHVDEQDNSAAMLRGAAAAVDDQNKLWSLCEYPSRIKLPLSKREIREIGAVVERNRPALAMLAESRQKKAADWNMQLSSMM